MGVSIWTHHAAVGRNFGCSITEGQVIFKQKKGYGEDVTNDRWILDMKGGDIIRQTHIDGKTKEKKVTEYGVGEKIYKHGKLFQETAFKQGTNQARIYKGEWRVTKTKLAGFHGKRYQNARGGSISGEKYVYRNGKTAYKVGRAAHKGTVVYPNGRVMATWKGSRIDFIRWDGKGLFDRNGDFKFFHKTGTSEMFVNLFKDRTYEFEVFDRRGKTFHKGKVENRQRVGEWVEFGEKTFYLQGVKVSHKLWSTPAEKLDSKEIMSISNVQLRTSLCMKKGYGVILKDLGGSLIHKDGEYELYEMPILKPRVPRWNSDVVDKVIRLLKVKCPTTGTYYTLRVPPQINTCEEARQWTFKVVPSTQRNVSNDGISTMSIPEDRFIKFVQET